MSERDHLARYSGERDAAVRVERCRAKLPASNLALEGLVGKLRAGLDVQRAFAAQRVQRRQRVCSWQNAAQPSHQEVAAFVPRNSSSIRGARRTPKRVQDERLGSAAVAHLVHREQRQRANAGRQQLRAGRVERSHVRERPGGERSARLRADRFQRRVAGRKERLRLHFVQPHLGKRVVSLRREPAVAEAAQLR